jgi:hypothetical protein
MQTLPCGQPSVPETKRQKSTKYILQIPLSANGAADTVFPTLFGALSQETKRPFEKVAHRTKGIWPNEKGLKNLWKS